MCRLAMLNKKGFKNMEESFGVKLFFDFLEKAMGGQGNGYLLVKSGKIVGYDKGVKLSNEEIVNVANTTDFDWLLYHTRVVSKGNVCDEQCHPFVSPDNNLAIAMNGTESHFGEIGKLMGTSDTDALFRIYHSLDIDVSTLKTLDSRFMGFKKVKGSKGKMFFTNPTAYYSSLELMVTNAKDKGIVVASCFPTSVKSSKIESGYHWEEGSKIKTNSLKYTKYEPKVKYDYRNYTKKNTEVIWECLNCGDLHSYNGYHDLTTNTWKIGECSSCGDFLQKLIIDSKEAELYKQQMVD